MCHSMDHYFELAAKATIAGMKNEQGGPFGATIVRNGEVIAAVGNTMVKDTDPSAHAEMVAVREACKKLGTMDLSECEVYATCEPCPMCVSVMMWANVKKVYYSNNHQDADLHGFSDSHLRKYLDGSDRSLFTMEDVGHRPECDQLWAIFKEINPE